MNEYFFTFGCGQEHGGRVQKIIASSCAKARELMFKHFGDAWCFQYTAEQWKEAGEHAKAFGYSLEREMDEVITEEG